MVYDLTSDIGEVETVFLGGLAPSNPGDFFFLGDLLFGLGLELDLEFLVGSHVDSGVVSLGLLLASDLSEHSRSLSELGTVINTLPLASDLGLASNNHRSIEHLVFSFLNNHVRDSLSGVNEVEV
jgi:hypothetical protein